jgi:hypothetical protein
VGHLDAVDRIERALPPGVVVAGQAYRGAGIPDSIRQGAEAAGRVSAYVSGRAGVTAEGPAEGAEAAAEAAAEGAEGERVR